MRKPERGQTLVASLIVIAIMAILAVVLLRGSNLGGEMKSNRADGKGLTIPGAAMAAAQDDACMANIRQLRMSLNVNTTTDDQYPATLEETRLGENFLKCPLGGERYEYDASTGKVTCPHPGHRKY